MLDFLRSVWAEPRPPDAPRRVWRDWVLVAVFGLLAVVEGVLRPELPWRVAVVTGVVALVPTLLWRRTRPLLTVVVAFAAASAGTFVRGTDMYASAYVLILLYALLRWGSGREVAAGLLIVTGNVALSMVVNREGVADVIGGAAIVFGTAALGAAVRYRAGVRLRELDRVKLLERSQLARDLHDTVAHHVSAMAIRAQVGLATADADPDAATEALRVIEAEAARALAEMRALVRVLRRGEPAELAPGPRLADLAGLAGRERGGANVEVTIVGDVTGLPAAVETAVFRLAQESVTNARRHARHATRIEVRVDAEPAAVRLRVSDDGDGGVPRPGYGITGMIERAGLLGGSCTAGPEPGRGWTVRAELPVGVVA